jgi:isopentenyl diphosphate isomerase/L-lactate dehydrogenase-like FMN-dependent dehydrogenase
MIERATSAELARIVSLTEFEPLARARMAPDAFDFVAGGAWDEISLAESVTAWQRWRFRPRVLTGAPAPDPSGRFLGRPSTLPVAVAPMAFQALAHPDGEIAMARAAAAAGVPFCLSTSASMTLEAVAAAVPDAERWYQLYNIRDLAVTRSLVERAAAAGYGAIVLTVDLPVLGYRERDRRSGFIVPAMANLDPDHRPGQSFARLDQRSDFVLSWADIGTIRTWSALPLVLKGILTAEDAELAVAAGVDGIVVSAHGARQLDRTVTTADVLEEIAAAVAGRTEVWVDGGIRRGLDILVAHALGASGVLLGRPLYWALAAGGQAGVERALAIVAEELALAMPLLGVGRLEDIDRAHVR